jgi:integrase
VDGRRRRKTLYGRTKAQARERLNKANRDKDAGTLVLTQTTVEAWFTYWLDNIAARRIKPQTMRSYRSKVDRYVIPQLGRHRLTELRPAHIRGMYDSLRAQGLAEATVRQTHAIVRKGLKDAVNEGKIALNPAERVDPPSTKVQKRDGLTIDQARAVLTTAGDDPRWWLALFYGMRQGECLGLRWGDIDFERHTMTIHETLQTDVDGSLIFGDPKAAASTRLLPLLPQVEVRLLLHQHAPDATGLVFARPDGKPIRPRDDWQAWTDLLVAATRPPWAPIPHVALHAARNSSASLLEAAGVPERVVMQILGQSQVQVTRSYQNAELETMRRHLDAGMQMLALD